MPRGVYDRNKPKTSKKLKLVEKQPKEKKALMIDKEPKIISNAPDDFKPVEWKIDDNIPLPPIRRSTLANKYPTLFKLKPGQSVFVGNDKKELDRIMGVAQKLGKEKHCTFYFRERLKAEHGEQGFRVWCHVYQEPKPRKARKFADIQTQEEAQITETVM